VCKRIDGESVMLLCHHCADGFHIHCLTPPLEHVPLGIWLCPKCTGAGVTEADIAAAIDQQNQRVLEQQQPEHLTPTILNAQKLNGRFITGRFLLKGQQAGPRGGRAKPQTQWAKLKYAGVAANGKPVLLAVWEDGEVTELTPRQCSTQGRTLQPAKQQPPARCTFPRYDSAVAAAAPLTTLTAAASGLVSKAPVLLELQQPGGAAVQATLQFEAQLQPWPFAASASMSSAVTRQLWSAVARQLDLTSMATLTLLNGDLLSADAGDAFPWLHVAASCVIATSLQLVQPAAGMQALFAALTDATAAQLVAMYSALQPAATLLVLSGAQAPLLVESLAGAKHTAAMQLCLPGGRSFTLGVVCPTLHVLAAVTRQVLTCSE
jgi:PHD-finger